VSDPELGEIPHIRIPIMIGESAQVRTVAPKLGQQNAEIFRYLGLTDAEMHRLRERGVP
jgi:crotonobetainyl-CoA:carnitine CoA-transferase CaiB-like acyl-CoA transferase